MAAGFFLGYVFDEEELTEYSKMSLSWASLKKRPAWNREVEKYDLMMQYRETIPMEEQDAIWAEVGPALERRGRDMRKVAAKRAFVKPEKD